MKSIQGGGGGFDPRKLWDPMDGMEGLIEHSGVLLGGKRYLEADTSVSLVDWTVNLQEIMVANGIETAWREVKSTRGGGGVFDEGWIEFR